MPAPEITSTTQTLIQGLTFDWLNDGKIASWTWRDVSRPVVDAYVTSITAVTQDWDKRLPFLQLHDLLYDGFSFTPYLRSKVQQVIGASRSLGLHGRVALVVPQNFMMTVIEVFIRLASLLSGQTEEIRIFNNRTLALNWLTEKIQPKSD